MKKKILLADDHQVFRKGVKALLEERSDLEVVAEAGGGLEALEMVKLYEPDLALLDLRMPQLSGFRAAEKIMDQYPNVKVVILSMHEEASYVKEAMQIGVHGFVCKTSPPEVLFETIKTVCSGKTFYDPALENQPSQPSEFMGEPKKTGSLLDRLTKREKEILVMLASGLTNAEAAEQLHLSRRTVETHRNNLTKKLNLTSRIELVRFALDNDLLKGSLS